MLRTVMAPATLGPAAARSRPWPLGASWPASDLAHAPAAAGFCPGPALVALGSGMGAAGVFVAAMRVGMVLHDRLLVRG